MENWKVIEKYNRYAVSNYGRVKNILTGQIISQRKASNGYMRVNVRTGETHYEKPITLTVHRIVADAFIEKVNGKEYVNHIDGDKTNNKATNLEWCTASGNSKHAYNNNLCDCQHKYASNIRKAQDKHKHRILIINKINNEVLGAFDKRHAAEILGVNEKTIYNYMNGITENKTNFILKRGW